MGTAFVTLTDALPWKEAIRIFNTFKKGNSNKRLIESLLINDWTLERAPKASDVDWKNLAYDKNHRCTRKTSIGLFLLLTSIVVLMPINLLEQYLPLRS